MLQKLKHKYRQFQAWLEKMKYRNVDVNDPAVQAEIKANEEYNQRLTAQFWFTLKLCLPIIFASYLLLLFEGTQITQEIKNLWKIVTNLF